MTVFSQEINPQITGGGTCDSQEKKFKDFVTKAGPDIKNIFGQEFELHTSTSSSLEMAYTGKNHEKVLLLMTDDDDPKLYLWEVGRDLTFTNISDRIHRDQSGIELGLHLYKHPLNSEIIFITALTYQGNFVSDLHISLNSGDSFTTVNKLNFTITKMGGFIFHPSKPDHILFLDSSDRLHFSKNYGLNWVNIANDTLTAKWGQSATCPHCIFISRNNKSDFILFELLKNVDPYYNTLMRSEDYGATWKVKREHIYSFGLEGNFTYVSVYTDSSSSSERMLLVSLNDGDHWSRVRLPKINNDQFFSILDSTDGFIFIHVDDDGNTGKGVLYTSDATGVIFSESLKHHLYPNYEDLTDFYAVQSMKGVYITNQIMPDNSVKTVISYNRGAEWVPIPRPPNVKCLNESKPCNLQVHNQYSISQGVVAYPLTSAPNAVGIIMVHGIVADSLQTTPPDVFISNDGGYNWYLGLKGPHHYQIADHGGLLVAVPADTPTPNVIKFSTDVGRCWSSYNFTNEVITFTGLLIAPGSSDNVVAVWGYSGKNESWHTFKFNFANLIDKTCGDDDYEPWMVTSQHSNDNCFLGSKDTFMRLKKDSWCLNGKMHKVDKKTEICPCTKDDYGCDYGYVRVGEECVQQDVIDQDIHICLRNHHQQFVPQGYHKVPGDVCEDGYMPKEAKLLDLNSLCDDDLFKRKLTPEELLKLKSKLDGEKSSALQLTTYYLLAVSVVVVVVVVLLYAAMKFNIIRRYRTMRYKYTSIHTDDVVDSFVGVGGVGGGNVVVSGGGSGGKNKSSTSMFDDSDEDSQSATSLKPGEQQNFVNGYKSAANSSNGIISSNNSGGSNGNSLFSSGLNAQPTTAVATTAAATATNVDSKAVAPNKGFIHPVLLGLTNPQSQQQQQPQQQHLNTFNKRDLDDDDDAKLLDSDADLLE